MVDNSQNIYTTDQEDSFLSFSEIWSLFWNHKWWYLLSLVLCLCLAVMYLYRTPKQYSRTLKVMIDESTQDAAMRNLGVASAGMYRMRNMNSVENEVESFKSPDLMEEVVLKLDLQAAYFEVQPLRTVEYYQKTPVLMTLAGGNLSSGFSCLVEKLHDNHIKVTDFRNKTIKDKSIIEADFGDTVQTPVGALVFRPTAFVDKFEHPVRIYWNSSHNAAKQYAKKLSVSFSGKESSVVVLNMQDRFPKRAELVLNTLLDVYNQEWVANKNRAAIKTTSFINERLAVIEHELNVVEKSLKDYKESKNLTDLEAVAQVQIQESSRYAAKSFEVSNQLAVAHYIQDYLNDPTNSLSLIPSNVGLDRSSSSVDSQIKEYNDILIQRDRLIAGSSENNPLIADMTMSLQAMRSAILRSTDNLIATLQMQQDKLDAQEKTILSQMTSSTGQAFELLSIEREQKIKQELYVFLLQKREENELAALVNVGNTRLIMNPNGSNAPVAPQSMMVLLVALVLGFGLPFSGFFLYKILDKKIRTRTDLGQTPVPFLAEIPHYSGSAKSRNIVSLRSKQQNQTTYGIVVEAGKRDMMNEAYRVLRTNTDMMLGLNAEGAKVIMMTSFLPSSGKSVTIKNLAASMALKDAKVLLIDLDLRKGTLGKSLGLNHSGVAGYLNGKNDDYVALCDEIAPNLFVLPVGSLPPNPSELLLSQRFKTLMEDARSRFDYIFIDCPPINLVVDARIVTEYVDMTIFVLRSAIIDKDVLPQLNELYSKGTYKHMALILNDVELKYKKYGYGRQSYGYGYGN